MRRQSAEAFGGAIPRPHRPLFDGATRIAGDAGDPGSAARRVPASPSAALPRCIEAGTPGADAIGDTASTLSFRTDVRVETRLLGARGEGSPKPPLPTWSETSETSTGFAAPGGIPSSRSLSSHSRRANLGSRAGKLGFLGAQSA